MDKILRNASLDVALLMQELNERPADSIQLDKESEAFLMRVSAGHVTVPEEIQEGLEPLLAALPDDGLGLRAGARVSISDFDAFGYALLSSRNMRSVHDLILAYRKILRTLHGVSFRYGKKHFRCEVSDLLVSGRSARFFIECWLQTHFRFTRLFLDKEWPFERVSLAFPEPPYAHAYREEFGCPVDFNAETTGYEASSELLDLPFLFTNDEVRRFCEERCVTLLKAMNAEEKTVARVRTALLRQPGWFPKSDEMAKSLGLSPRTFRRRLNAENSSYQAVLESVRKELAAEYLKFTHLTVEDIAYRLGFIEANSFYKAFRRWYGTSPKSYAKTS